MQVKRPNDYSKARVGTEAFKAQIARFLPKWRPPVDVETKSILVVDRVPYISFLLRMNHWWRGRAKERPNSMPTCNRFYDQMQLVIIAVLLVFASSSGLSLCISDTANGGGVVGYGYRIESVALESTADTGRPPSKSLHAHLRLIKGTSIFGPDIQNLHLAAQ